MLEIIVKRFKCDCGRTFSTKRYALNHEQNCKCWTNPKFKTCKTCKFGSQIWDSNGMEHEPQYLHRWKQWHCSNPIYHDGYFTPAHKNAPDLNINCALHITK